MKMRTLIKCTFVFAVIGIAIAMTFAKNKSNQARSDTAHPQPTKTKQAQAKAKIELKVLSHSIHHVTKYYVEPDRINYSQMLLAGLNAIQKIVSPLIVHYESGHQFLELQVNNKRRMFPTAIRSPWDLLDEFQEIFHFLKTNLKNEEYDFKELEYTAINGMLQTLDPHTILLKPTIFQEMQTQTRGEFGGLGIVISIRDGFLTIIRPLPNTPATKAGLRKNDRIVKIKQESTLNMPLSAAVKRMRGRPNTKVRIWIKRKQKDGSWSEELPFDVTRDVIHIDSIKSNILKSQIGYVKINNFQGNTYSDLRKTLEDMKKQNIRGLIMDLRNNPGGLLDQAIKVADLFLEKGIIVSTSSKDPNKKSERQARSAGTQPNYPIVILINESSASASEIVAGALKGHDRALIIGKKSFGKGSVQVLHKLKDGSALKLTVAHYLTPGWISIQKVGITPHIVIESMTVDRWDMDLIVDEPSSGRESDLESALTSKHTKTQEKPSALLRYYLSSKMRQHLREADPQDQENKSEHEFLIRFSKRLLLGTKNADRKQMLHYAKQVIEKVQSQEMKKAIDELRKHNIDWSVGKDKGPSKLQVKAFTNKKNNIGKAGEPFSLNVQVKNVGSAPLYRVRGITKSDYFLFNDRELIFGKIDPGETKTWTTTLGRCKQEKKETICKLPKSTIDRADGIQIEFSELHNHVPPKVEIRTQIQSLPKPQFAYSYHLSDDIRGNADGVYQLGEDISMYLRIRNIGDGKAYKTKAYLRNLSGEGILLKDGRFDIDTLKKGEEHLVHFSFGILPTFKKKNAKLSFQIIDTELNQSIGKEIEIPIELSKQNTNYNLNPKKRSIAPGTVIYQKPSHTSKMIGKVDESPVRISVEAAFKDFIRIRTKNKESGWVKKNKLTSGKGGMIKYMITATPPILEVQAKQNLATNNDSIRIQGKAQDETIIRDLFIFNQSRKIYYQSTDKQKNKKQVAFDIEVPLQPGINYISVVAQENSDLFARKTFVIRKDGPQGQLLKTPDFISKKIWDQQIETNP